MLLKTTIQKQPGGTREIYAHLPSGRLHDNGGRGQLDEQVRARGQLDEQVRARPLYVRGFRA